MAGGHFGRKNIRRYHISALAYFYWNCFRFSGIYSLSNIARLQQLLGGNIK